MNASRPRRNYSYRLRRGFGRCARGCAKRARPSVRRRSEDSRLMFVHGLGTAHPARRYTKADCWDAFQTSAWFAKLDRRSRAIAQTVLLGENGIEARRLAVSSLADAFEIDPDTLHARFLEHAPKLASEAARKGAPRRGSRDGGGRGHRREHVHGLSLPRPVGLRRRAARPAARRARVRPRRARLRGGAAELAARRRAARVAGGAATSCRSAWSSAAPRCISTTTRAC